MNHALNRLTRFFLQKQEVCPEPRTDVVPSVCLTGALAVVIGYIWISSIYALLNSSDSNDSSDSIEEIVEVKEEPASSEECESSTDKSDTEEENM